MEIKKENKIRREIQSFMSKERVSKALTSHPIVIELFDLLATSFLSQNKKRLANESKKDLTDILPKVFYCGDDYFCLLLIKKVHFYSLDKNHLMIEYFPLSTPGIPDAKEIYCDVYDKNGTHLSYKKIAKENSLLLQHDHSVLDELEEESQFSL